MSKFGMQSIVWVMLVALTGASIQAADEAVQAPVITSPRTAQAGLNQNFTYQITAVNSPTSFGATNLPPGLNVDFNTGIISGQPSLAGNFTININATNSGGSDNQTLILVVAGRGEAGAIPQLTGATSATAIVGSAFNFNVTASGGPTAFGASNLPAGLSLDSASGLISGVPTQAGLFNVGLSASNSVGTGTGLLQINVLSTPAGDAPPVFTGPATAAGIVNEPFVYRVTFMGTVVPADVVGLPPGLIYEPTLGQITGTPTVVGVTVATVTATNDFGTSTFPLTITIVPAFFSTSNQDSDNDGFPDEIEVAFGSSPFDANSTPFGGSAAGSGDAPTIKSLGLRLNFAKPSSDTIALAATLHLPDAFDVRSQAVTVDIGGVVKVFHVDDKGTAVDGNDSLRLRLRPAARGQAGANAALNIRLARGNFGGMLLDEGLFNETIKALPRSVPVIVVIQQMTFRFNVPVLYTATQGRNGRTQLVRITSAN